MKLCLISFLLSAFSLCSMLPGIDRAMAILSLCHNNSEDSYSAGLRQAGWSLERTSGVWARWFRWSWVLCTRHNGSFEPCSAVGLISVSFLRSTCIGSRSIPEASLLDKQTGWNETSTVAHT